MNAVDPVSYIVTTSTVVSHCSFQVALPLTGAAFAREAAAAPDVMIVLLLRCGFVSWEVSKFGFNARETGW
jgi:hypothetical protein